MIQIHKDPNNEPASWTAYKRTPGAVYAPSNDLRNALQVEQGFICAFCMRRIPLSKRDPREAEFSKIAHLLTRANHPDRKFDYENMVLCCPGNINGVSHCDKSQGSTNITLLLFRPQLQASISFGSYTGEIKCSDADWNSQIQDILNLNNSLLKLNRLLTLNGIRQILESRRWTRARLAAKLEEWNNLDNQGKLKPYCGIVIWYLNKKLRQL